MPKREVYHIHPYGWEDDPEEERFKVSTLDYLTACTYMNFALFFRLESTDKPNAVQTLKAGLERTLAQARHLCGTIEKDPGGGHSFTKKKDSTVQFIVQWLDGPEDTDKYPSFDDIQKASFTSISLGDLKLWSVPPMTYGEKPEAYPDNSPTVSAFKANFVNGGLVLNMHQHHYANDIMGWAGLTHQLAENCHAILNKTAFPSWDPACLDPSRLCKPEPIEDAKIDGPTPPERHPAHILGTSLLFHLPKSKAAALKKLAAPPNGSWISTYDAFSAFTWRTLTRLRAPIFRPDMQSHILWGEAIDMRRHKRLHSPEVPARIQRNVMFAALSSTAPVTQPTVAEIISEWPLHRLASYIRQLTASVTQENLDKTLAMVATVRDKTALNIRTDSHPPLTVVQTDHRAADVTSADFGFGKPVIYRHLMDFVTEGVIIIYPPRQISSSLDEGPEINIFYEKRLAQDLIDDPEWNEYFEYRGIEAETAGYSAAPVVEAIIAVA